jgi:hypothetical protein
VQRGPLSGRGTTPTAARPSGGPSGSSRRSAS